MAAASMLRKSGRPLCRNARPYSASNSNSRFPDLGKVLDAGFDRSVRPGSTRAANESRSAVWPASPTPSARVEYVHAVIRQLLRKFSRNKVLTKRLPKDLGNGRIYCSPEALLSTWKPGWQSRQAQGLLQWVRRYVEPGMCVWDLGANQGIFSFAASAQAGPDGTVFAFEPDLFMVDLLRRSRATGSHSGAPVHILPIAVSDHDGMEELQIASTDRALNHLSSVGVNPHAGCARERNLVMCQSLNGLMSKLPKPDLLKIDIEGAEFELLRGGQEFLRTVRPVMILETAVKHRPAVAQLLRDLDYSIFEVDSGLDASLSSPAWNSLVWPNERTADLRRLRARIAA